MTREEMLRRMTLREYRSWVAEYLLEPWGEARADLRAGIIASTIANCHSKHGFKPSDFIPEFNVQGDMSDEKLMRMAMKSNAMLGGTFAKG